MKGTDCFSEAPRVDMGGKLHCHLLTLRYLWDILLELSIMNSGKNHFSAADLCLEASGRRFGNGLLSSLFGETGTEF